MRARRRSKSRTRRLRTRRPRPGTQAADAVVEAGMPGELPGEPASPGVAPSYFHGRPISSELIREFVAAAIAFRKEEPWRTFDAEEVIGVRAPALGIDDAAVSVINDEGHGGLQIFLDPEMLEALQGGSRVGASAGRGTLGVMFYGRQQLPPQLREEARRLPFMPVAGPIPALVAVDSEMRARPLTGADYVAATVILAAVTQFVAEVHAAYDLEWAGEEDDVPTSGEYAVVRGGTTVSVHVEREAPPEPTRAALVGEGPRPLPGAVHRLRVTLRDTRPPIWRRLVVPSTITLAQLHAVVQIAFGWEDDRSHLFNRKGQDIGPAESDAQFDETRTELWVAAPAVRDVLRYTYGHRTDWIHDIEVEEVAVVEEAQARPRCIDGRRAGPPEACRGSWALDVLIRDGRLADEDVRYDPTGFSLAEVDASLAEAFGSAGSEVASLGG